MSAQPADETGPAGDVGEPLPRPAPVPDPESLPESSAGPAPVPFPELHPVEPCADADADVDGCEVADVNGPDAADPVAAGLAGLVDEQGRIDPAVLQSLTEVLREAVSRLQVEGVGTRAGLAEVRGLGALAAVVAAGTQSSIAGYATRWVRADHRCPTGPDVVCHARHEGPWTRPSSARWWITGVRPGRRTWAR